MHEIPGIAPNTFQDISVSGTGLEAQGTFTPQGLSFNKTYLANVPAGATIPAPPQLTATLSNTGNEDLTISSVVTGSAAFGETKRAGRITVSTRKLGSSRFGEAGSDSCQEFRRPPNLSNIIVLTAVSGTLLFLFAEMGVLSAR